jgi:peptidoglycan/xylan/chitin deacetylase (PgdA/CDA1 family)
MNKRRDRLCQIAHAVGLLPALGSLRTAVVRNDLRVLAYHRVLPEIVESTFRFDTELLSATQAEFDWQMAYVAQRFQPVSCAQVIAALDEEKPLPKRAVMVTFDDGYHDNYDVAYPVLRKHGVPGLFFVSTGYIGTDQVFWFDWLVYVMLHTRQSHLELGAPLNLTITLGPDVASRRAEATKLLRLLKRTPEAQRLQILEQLRLAANVEVKPCDLVQSQIMTWAHIQEMSRAGMEFGSHTVTHPILSTVTNPELLRRELENSKAKIEHEIGKPVTTLAYPVGGLTAVNEAVLAATAKAGYGLAFTYQPGCNRLAPEERYLLKRIHVERYTTRHMFSAALELPELFS